MRRWQRPTRRQLVQASAAAGLTALGLAGLSRAGVPLPGRQSARPLPQVALLALFPKPFHEALRQELHALGYRDGETLHLDYRFADGRYELLLAHALDLVRQEVDVLVAAGPAASVVRRLPTRVPVVFVGSGDPIAEGLVTNLARPEGNLTGFSLLPIGTDLAKWLQLLQQAVPGLTAVGVLWDQIMGPLPEPAVTAATQQLGLAVLPLEVRQADDLAPAVARAVQQQVGGLAVAETAFLSAQGHQIVALTQAARLPTIGVFRELAEAGLLMTYGANFANLYRRAAHYVDKLLKGAKPADLPVEQPSTFDFVINLQTAQQLGLTIPLSVLQQATEVIQ